MVSWASQHVTRFTYWKIGRSKFSHSYRNLASFVLLPTTGNKIAKYGKRIKQGNNREIKYCQCGYLRGKWWRTPWSNIEPNGIKFWVLDTGCLFHMCPFKEWFDTYKERNSGKVFMGDDSSCIVQGIVQLRQDIMIDLLGFWKFNTFVHFRQSRLQV